MSIVCLCKSIQVCFNVCLSNQRSFPSNTHRLINNCINSLSQQVMCPKLLWFILDASFNESSHGQQCGVSIIFFSKLFRATCRSLKQAQISSSSQRKIYRYYLHRPFWIKHINRSQWICPFNFDSHHIMTRATLQIIPAGISNIGQDQPSFLGQMPASTHSWNAASWWFNCSGFEPISKHSADCLGSGLGSNPPVPATGQGSVPHTIDVSSISGCSANSANTPLFVPKIPSYHHLGQWGGLGLNFGSSVFRSIDPDSDIGSQGSGDQCT